MNFSMTFDKKAIFLLLLLLCLFTVPVEASGETALPPGEILVVYSDAAAEEDLEAVRMLVEILTYQTFQVTFAPASESQGNLGNFKNIIFYETDRYPEKLIRELYDLEQEAQAVLDARTDQNAATLGDFKILFIGSGFLKEYLDQTGRAHSYMEGSETVGTFTYPFNKLTRKEALVRAESFLFLNGEYEYMSGTIQTGTALGYFCAAKGVLTHINTGDMDSALVKAALTREVAQWKWPYNGEPHAYAQYMVLNQVYPFQDPDKLLEIVNMMVDRKEPFIISVMPVYGNGEYPAMQHFCEVLRYAQDNGGVIMLHSPINQMVDFDVDLVNEYITRAISIYMEHGVYPMGIQIPRSWLFNEDTIGITGRFRTVLMSEEVDDRIKADEDARTNLVYKDGHQWIAPAITLDADGTSYIKAHSTAVYFDITDDAEDIEKKIDACRNSFVPLKSLWDVEHSLWTDEDVITCKNRILLVNGKRVERTFVPTEYDENFSYNRNMLQRFSKDLSEGNHKLLLTVAAISFLFLLFILLARRNNRKRFYYEEEVEDKDEYWENKK